MSPLGIPTPEKALEDLKLAHAVLRGYERQHRAAYAEVQRIDRELAREQMAVKRAQSTLLLATSEAVANEPVAAG